MNEPNWVLFETVIAIHKRQIAEHGGLHGIRDIALLESALTAPRQLFHYKEPKPTLSQLAASYAFCISKNHPFYDGNKRVSLVVCEVFLRLNSYTLKATQVEKYKVFIGVANGDISQDKLAEWINKRTRKL